MAIAAEFPDIDTVWGLRGSVSDFEHHRGLTHTLLGIPFEAALLLLGFFLFHRFRASQRTPGTEGDLDRLQRSSRGVQPAPARWGLLYAFLLLGLLSHLLLDYTNNYGLRPFFPFNDRWYAGSFVFIFDPLLFLFLLAGLCLPWLFGLIGRELGATEERFRGRGWARAALVAACLLWSVRWFEHRRAVLSAQNQTLRAPGRIEAAEAPTALPTNASATLTSQATGLALPLAEAPRALLMPLRSLASPDPLSMFRWYTATDFGPAYRLGVADTRFGTWTGGQILNKTSAGSALLAGQQSRLGKIYQDWSAMPLCTSSHDVSDNFGESVPDAAGTHNAGTHIATVVRCSDLRFMGGLPWLRRGSAPPLSALILLDARDQVIAQAMDGRYEEP